MAYKIGSRRKAKEMKYLEEELKYLKQKKKLGLYEEAKEGERHLFSEPRLIHRKGELVTYKGKLAEVQKVEKNGVWLQPFSPIGSKKKDEPIFIKERDYVQNTKAIRFLWGFTSNLPVIEFYQGRKDTPTLAEF
jgi:hypothetical protein